MSSLDAVVVVAYFGLVVAAVFYVRRARSVGEFALGKQRFSHWIIFATLAATCIGPGYSVGLSGKVSEGGYIWIFVFLFFSLQMMFTGFILAPRLRAIKGAYTLGDVLGRRYGAGAKLLAGVVAFLFCAGVTGAIARATGSLASSLFGFDATVAIVISMVVVTAYSTIGGIKAVVLTDVLQFIVLAVVLPMILFFELPSTMSGVEPPLVAFNPGGLGPLAFLGLAVSFMFGEFLLPPYSQRALIARDSRAAKGGFILVAVFSAIWFFVIGSIGALGVRMFPEAAPDTVFFEVIRAALPSGLRGLVLAALLAIIASTQDSLLNSGSVAFTEDVANLRQTLPQRTRLRVTVSMCLASGVAATAFALYAPSIIDALLVVYTLWAPIMVMPLLFAILSERTSPAAGLAGMIAGGGTTAIWSWVLMSPMGLPPIVPGLLVSAVVTWAVGAWGPRECGGIMRPLELRRANESGGGM